MSFEVYCHSVIFCRGGTLCPPAVDVAIHWLIDCLRNVRASFHFTAFGRYASDWGANQQDDILIFRLGFCRGGTLCPPAVDV